jgi:hypothetical protein
MENLIRNSTFTDPKKWNVKDMKIIDNHLKEQGLEPFFGRKHYMPHNVVMARMNGIHETQGNINNDYVCFKILSKPTGTNGTIKIHNELLNKLSVEDYNKEERKFPFKLEWSGKNTKIKQPCYYPTHMENNQNNPLPLKNLLFPHIPKKKWKGRFALKIRFIDGNRLHWSLSNIEIMTSKQYNNHPNKNNLIMLDNWVF